MAEIWKQHIDHFDWESLLTCLTVQGPHYQSRRGHCKVYAITVQTMAQLPLCLVAFEGQRVSLYMYWYWTNYSQLFLCIVLTVWNICDWQSDTGSCRNQSKRIAFPCRNLLKLSIMFGHIVVRAISSATGQSFNYERKRKQYQSMAWEYKQSSNAMFWRCSYERLSTRRSLL